MQPHLVLWQRCDFYAQQSKFCALSNADVATSVCGGSQCSLCASPREKQHPTQPWVLFHTPTESNTHSATLHGAVGCTHMFFSGTHAHAGQTYTAHTCFLIQRRGWKATGGRVPAIVRRNRGATGWRCRGKKKRDGQKKIEVEDRTGDSFFLLFAALSPPPSLDVANVSKFWLTHVN